MSQTSTQQPPRSGNTLDDAFARLRAGDLRRDTGNRWFGGVCAGLAWRFGVDPLLIRAAAIALTVAGGLGIPLYLVLWLLLPDREGTVLAERALRHGDVWPVVLGVVTTVFLVGGLVSLGIGGDGWGGGSLWIVVPVVLVVWFLATRSRAQAATPWSGPGHPAAPTPPPPPPPGGDPMSGPTSSSAPPAQAGQAYAAPPTAGQTSPAPYGGPPPTGPYGAGPVPPLPPRPLSPPPPPAPRRRRPSGYVGLVSLGLAALLFGLGVLLEGPLGVTDDPPVLGFAMALAGVAAVVLGLGLSGRASGFSGFLVVVLGFLTVLSGAANHVEAGDGFGDRAWTPTASSLPATYSLGAGDAVLDLGSLPTSTGASTPALITTEMGAGQLTIEVPEGLDVRIEASAGVGEIQHERFGPDGTDEVARRSGTDPSYVARIGEDPPEVVVRSQIGFGDIIIEEN